MTRDGDRYDASVGNSQLVHSIHPQMVINNSIFISFGPHSCSSRDMSQAYRQMPNCTFPVGIRAPFVFFAPSHWMVVNDQSQFFHGFGVCKTERFAKTGEESVEIFVVGVRQLIGVN
jgi:hypothetical protein